MLIGGGGDDILVGGAGDDFLYGNGGNDFLYGNEGADLLDGDTGNDYLIGGAGNDSLFGGDGDDAYYFTGNTNLGSDSIHEGASEGTWDWLHFTGLEGAIDLDLNSTSTRTISTGLLSLTLSDAAGVEAVSDTSYGDIIKGNARNNSIWITGGDDYVEGRGGNDYYYYTYGVDHGSDTLKEESGGGSDFISFEYLDLDDDDSTDGITLDLRDDMDNVLQEVAKVTIDDVTTTLVELTLINPDQFEVVAGSDYDDTIYGHANTYVFYGLAGNDTLDGGDGSATEYLYGGDGDDTIFGGGGNDYINGEAGNDFLSGDVGNDLLYGGDGDDTYWFNPNVGALGSDTIYEDANEDSDTLDFRNFTDNLTVNLTSTTSQTIVSSVLTLTIANYNTAIENIVGGAGGDNFTGNSRPNIIDGRGGGDTIDGGGGADRLYGGAGADTLYGGNDDDVIYGGDGDDAIYPGDGNDFAYGERGDDYVLEDYLYGDGGNDYFDGGDGDDNLNPGVGNDILVGGTGDDTLVGGTGDDTYSHRWSAGDFSLGSDTISEYSSGGTDTVDFENFFAPDYDDPVLSSTDLQIISAMDVGDVPVAGQSAVTRDLLTITFTTASNVEGNDDPATFTSSVSRVIVDFVTKPDTLRLIAAGVQGQLDTAEFYFDANDNLILDGGDILLGEDTSPVGGWMLELQFDPGTGSWTLPGGPAIELEPCDIHHFIVLPEFSHEPGLAGVGGGFFQSFPAPTEGLTGVPQFIRDPEDAPVTFQTLVAGFASIPTEYDDNTIGTNPSHTTDKAGGDFGNIMVPLNAGDNTGEWAHAEAQVSMTAAVSAAPQGAIGVSGNMLLASSVHNSGDYAHAIVLAGGSVHSGTLESGVVPHRWTLVDSATQEAPPVGSVVVQGEVSIAMGKYHELAD